MLPLRVFSVLPVTTLLTLLTLAESAHAVTSAELYRTEPLGFGKFEARVQFVPGDGVIGSFFLWKDGSEKSDVYWNELDFEKLGADCHLQTNSIFGLPQTNHEDEGYDLDGLCEGYHTYAYEWTPDYISWSVDGVEIRRDTGADAAAYADNAPEGMQMRFNVWPGNANFGGNFDESILPVYEFVAWAQFSEYTPSAGEDGSDFTFSWREEFDTEPAGWAKGSWESPLSLSTHSSENVVFVDGIAVLALTADDAPGYSGTPPADDSSPSTGGTDGAGGSDGVGGSVGGGGSTGVGGSVGVGGSMSGSGSALGVGGSEAAAGGAGSPSMGQSGGCSYSPLGPRWAGLGFLSLMVAAATSIGHRRLHAQAKHARGRA